MASPAIFSNFFEEQLTQTTHNTFRDCRVHFFCQPFSKQLYIIHPQQLTVYPPVTIKGRFLFPTFDVTFVTNFNQLCLAEE